MTDCIEKPGGILCPEPSDWSTCRPWDITEQDRLNCFADNLLNEGVNIAGAKVNVRKLLGVQEQTSLMNLANNGNAISGGDWVGFPAPNAFDILATEWRSHQGGSTAILASAYIGYDFGIIKIDTGRQRYGIDTSIRHHITTLRIKQSSNPNRRVTKARVERSTDGLNWYGVAVIDLPNNDSLTTISFKHSVPNRYWRLRPLVFVGGATDSWGVQALELHEHMVSAQDNIQDKIWMENRNRDYATDWIEMKGFYTLLTPELDVTKFFGEVLETGTYRIKLPFSATITALGRPVIIGDYLELPSEQQYTPTLAVRKRYLEVTDVTWDPETYTPGWVPLMLLVTAKPAIASEETQQIFGDLAKKVDTSGLFNNDDGNNPNYQDYSTVEQTIDQEARNRVPERGAEGSNVFREFEDIELNGFATDILAADATLNTFRIRGDYRSVLPVGSDFAVSGSVGNNGSYIVTLPAPTFVAGVTTVTVASVPMTHGAFGRLFRASTIDEDGFGHIRKLNFNRIGLYVEDAIPQNNAEYSEGPTFPVSPADGDYHRLVYVGLAKDVPARLHRWSEIKGRWIYLETDRREQFNNQKAVLEEYLTSTTRKPAEEIK